MKTRKERIIWESKQEVQLVDFIKTKEHVWNNANSNFTNLRMRKKVFAEFAANLGGQYSVKAVRERWTNIRNTFMHNVRRIERTKQSAKIPEDIYEPSWHLWERCQFLQVIKDCKSKYNSSDELTLNQIKEENDTSLAEDLIDGANSSEDVNTEDPITFNSLRHLPPSSAAAIMARSTDNKSTDKSACEQVLQEALFVLKTLQNEMAQEESSGDTKFLHISKHVAERLSKMKPFDAECASRKIMDVLALYSEFNPYNPNKS